MEYWMQEEMQDFLKQNLEREKWEEELKTRLPCVFNINQLIVWLNKTSNSELRESLESRIAELLPAFSDMDQLLNWWKIIPSGSEAEKFFEFRMREIVYKVDIDAPWFLDVLGGRLSLPPFLKKLFLSKIQFLCNSTQ